LTSTLLTLLLLPKLYEHFGALDLQDLGFLKKLFSGRKS